MIRRSVILLCLLAGSVFVSAQGLRLFSPAARNAVESRQLVVLDFLERYFSELATLKQPALQQRMTDDKVYFREGRLEDLRQIDDAMPFSINLVDRHYEVSWQQGELPFVTVVFPAQYDLLMGMSQEKAQQQLCDALLAAPVREASAVVPNQPVAVGDGVYMEKSEIMELESLSDAVYYNKVEEDFVPVSDDNYAGYSAANLFRGLLKADGYTLNIDQSVYGLKTVSYTLPLDQWLNYCAEQGLKVYFGVERNLDEGLLAVVIAHSDELGYNHLLSVLIPNGFVESREAVFKVRMTPYIPTHNVKDLYQQQLTENKKKTWE